MAGRFDKSAFVERIKGLNIHAMIEAARSEIFDTESRYHGVRGETRKPATRAACDTSYS